MSNDSEASAYAKAGVDIAAGQHATELMKRAVQSTYTPQVLAGLGNFGGLFDVSALKAMEAPVLVASTDGVGTKMKVAARLERWDTIGYDIVNHCINDILVQGARPLFFLDYVASSKLHPEQIATIVGGIAAACRIAGCALLGGETAEMPGVYEPDEIDLVGTVIGVVDRPQLIDGSRIRAGDAIVALPSSGPHTNGYTLIRSVLDNLDWNELNPELGTTIGAALLAPHRSYLADVQHLLSLGVDIRGLAHITGGGIVDNLPRILPDGVGAVIQRGTWPELPVFDLIQRIGAISAADMFHAFNMGVGMLVIVPESDVPVVQGTIETSYVIGRITVGAKKVYIDG
ncbi:MAG: phosphoribosylformylglycinamidine cyclo-ligase [Anaerolineae bacterium]|nr:phosphoribosylformylglycinamidine cyclo-ligase [Anaerolineae bacterium]